MLNKAKPKLSVGRFQRATTSELILLTTAAMATRVISLSPNQLSMLLLVYNVLPEAG